MSRRDWTGSRVGRLRVLHQKAQRVRGRIIWACQCDCGNRISVPADNLRPDRPGGVKSCGCLLAEHRQRFVTQYQRRIIIQHTALRSRNHARRAAQAVVVAARPVPEEGEPA